MQEKVIRLLETTLLQKYFVKSFISLVAAKQNQQMEIQHIFTNIWEGWAPPKVELMVWFAILGRLCTKDRLKKINLLHGDNFRCVFCGVMEESNDYLFIHCMFTWKIWCMCMSCGLKLGSYC